MGKTKRIFIIGEEWLYYKVYCGARTADTILTDTVGPLIKLLIKNHLIDQWFFMRYNDPDFHLRIRFHLVKTEQIGTVIIKIMEALQPHIMDDVIYKVQTDTYIRELERYGDQNIQISETLFYKESEFLLWMLKEVKDETLYVLGIIKIMDMLLDHFGFSQQEKMKFSKTNATAYKKEFKADKRLTKQLDKKYRNLQEKIIPFLSGTSNKEAQTLLTTELQHYFVEITPIINEIIENSNSSKPILSKEKLISSYIHMLVNRALRSKQRFYELVCYDFLSKYYKELINRK